MLKWLGTRTGLKTVIAVLAIALVISLASQIVDGSSVGDYLTGASARPQGEDPLTAFTYGLEIGGRRVGLFTSASGIGSVSDVVEHKVASDTGQEIIQKVPGRLTWTPVTLERGLTSALEIWEWRQQVIDGDVRRARTNCSIVAFDANGQEVARWDLENAWPSAVSAPASQDESTQHPVETITLVHEGIKRVK